jgi:hypothetical protein
MPNERSACLCAVVLLGCILRVRNAHEPRHRPPPTHPLIQHKLTLMREKDRSTSGFPPPAARDRAS